MAQTNQSTWLKSIQDTLDLVGLQELWNNHEDYSDDFPSTRFKAQITNKFHDQWENEISHLNNESKLRTYKLFKTDLKFERYLEVVKDFEIRKNITRLRISAHSLYIETGRHKRPTKVPVDQRLCDPCNNIEDEYHFIMACSKYNIPRNNLIKKIQEIFVDSMSYNRQDLFVFIMKLEDTELINSFHKFMKACILLRGKSL